MKNIRFMNWATMFLIFVLLINVFIAYQMTRIAVFTEQRSSERLLPIIYFANVLFFLGIILTVLGVINKEKKDIRFYFSVIGYLLLMILPFVFKQLTNAPQ